MAERSKALVLGTSHYDGVGSNPTAANSFIFASFIASKAFRECLRMIVVLHKEFILHLFIVISSFVF